jgi:hypothetical protein
MRLHPSLHALLGLPNFTVSQGHEYAPTRRKAFGGRHSAHPPRVAIVALSDRPADTYLMTARSKESVRGLFQLIPEFEQLRAEPPPAT